MKISCLLIRVVEKNKLIFSLLMFLYMVLAPCNKSVQRENVF